MKATSERMLTVIYCDDIRHEIGNKISFMGCYQGELFVPTMPMVLSKLCLFISVLTPKGRPFKSLTLRAMQDETIELARSEIPPEGVANLPDVEDDTATRRAINTAMVFSHFVIEKPTVLRVLAQTDEGEIIGPRLHIKVAPEMVPAVSMPPPETVPSVVAKKPRRNKTAPTK